MTLGELRNRTARMRKLLNQLHDHPDLEAEVIRRLRAQHPDRFPTATAEDDTVILPIFDCDDCMNNEALWDFPGGQAVRCVWCGFFGLGCPDFSCIEE